MKTVHELLLEVCGPGPVINYNKYPINFPSTVIVGPCCVGPEFDEEVEINLNPSPEHVEAVKKVVLSAVSDAVDEAFRKRGNKDG